jgi:hypothetical protein
MSKPKKRKRELVTEGDPSMKFVFATMSDFAGEDYLKADDLKVIGEQLIASVKSIAQLSEVKIIYLWKRKGPEKPRRVLGTCQRVSGLLGFFTGGADFIITLNVNNCQWFELTKWQIEAVVFHELKHGGLIDGKPALMPHDCELFAEDIQRYGLWKADLAKIADAAHGALQLPFEEDLPLPAATPEQLARDPEIKKSLKGLQDLADKDGATISMRIDGEEVVLAKPRDKAEKEVRP